MCIVFTCGEHTFRKEVEGYEGLVCRCYNCGNYSGSVIKSNPWFTFCFIVSAPTPNLRRRPQPACTPKEVAIRNQLANSHRVASAARVPALSEGLRRSLVPHLQLPATALEPARRSGPPRATRPGDADAAAAWTWRTAAGMGTGVAETEPADDIRLMGWE
jgi:hypothetical protein